MGGVPADAPPGVTHISATDVTKAFTPPTIRPPERPLNAVRGMAALFRNPIRFWPQALYREPVYFREIGGRKFLHVACPLMARAMLLDRAEDYARSAIANRVLKEALGDGLLTTDGAPWRRQRRLAAPSFRPQVVSAFAPTMLEAADRAADRLLAAAGADRAGGGAGRVVDVMPEVIQATFDVVTETMIETDGVDYDRRAMAADTGVFLENMGRVDPFDIFGAPRWLPRPWKWRGRRAVARLRATAARMAAEKRARIATTPGETGLGLGDRLIRAADPDAGGALTDREVLDNLMTFIGAGHETTALALTWTLWLLAAQPALQEQLAAEARALDDAALLSAEALEAAPLITRVLKESMRLYPPVAALGRSVARETKLGALDLKPGDHVSLAIYVLHRHHAHWDAPDAFDPDRFAASAPAPDRFAYLPFGGGPMICIGVAFAQLEATVMLAALLRKLRLGPGPDRAVEPMLRVTLRPKGGMPLAVAPR